MNDIVLKTGQLMDFAPMESVQRRICDANISIYYVLTGKLTVAAAEHRIVLGEKDFCVLNSYVSHTVIPGKEFLAMKFVVNQNMLADYYDISNIEFFGNSVEESSSAHDQLRQLLDQCISYYYAKKEEDGRSLLKLNSIYYHIAELLIFSFALIRGERSAMLNSEESMVQEMEKYIRLNYRQPIRLENMAEKFYLSTSYVSRFFKKNTGTNFAKYVAEIRVSEAMRLIENTESPITKIAADVGFPNLNAFNHAFEEVCGMKPREYQKEWQNKKKNIEDHTDDIAFQLMDYIENSREERKSVEQTTVIEQVDADTGRYSVLYKTWNKVINVGAVSLLLQRTVQDHILYLHQELQYEYFRIWDLFAADLHLNVGGENHKINFSRLDRCLDFLTENHLKPYIELGFKPYILIKDYRKYAIYEERDILFDTPKAYGDFVKRLVSHFINRYSAKEVATWIFEFWCDPRWFDDGKPTKYIDYFEQIYREVKRISPLTKVGCNYDRTYKGIIDFERLIAQWCTSGVQPDFMAVYCYHSIVREMNEGEIISVNDAMQFSFSDYLDDKREIMDRYGMRMPIYVSEWNFTVINHNPLNDSLFKGAYIMDTLMRNYDKCDFLGYWFGTDLFAEDEHTPLLLNGRCGLMTHQRICKPAFWSISFLNRLEDYILANTGHAMVTMNDFDSYVIACHNYKKMDVQYYVQPEWEIKAEDVYKLYSDYQKKIFKIRISGVMNGHYHIKIRSVNSANGSVQDEWLRMGKVSYLTSRDVEYADHMARPRMTIVEPQVTDHMLCIDVELEQQEIQLIHAFRYVAEE